MSSTTYEHPGGVTEMYAVQEQFRHVTKMVKMVGICKICAFDLKHWLKSAIFVNEFNFFILKSSIHHLFAVIGNMVRNAGQLPQPFWLGAACGGGSRSAARCAARA